MSLVAATDTNHWLYTVFHEKLREPSWQQASTLKRNIIQTEHDFERGYRKIRHTKKSLMTSRASLILRAHFHISAHQSPQPKRYFDRFSPFRTAHSRMSSGMSGMPFPSQLPLPMGDLYSHLIRGFLGPSDSASKQHLDRFSRFCSAH